MPKAKELPKGRRPAPSKAVEQKHRKRVVEAQKKIDKLDAELNKARNVLAQRLSDAMEANVQTKLVAEDIGQSRQNVYKLVRERVQGKPLGSSKLPPGARNGKPQ